MNPKPLWQPSANRPISLMQAFAKACKLDQAGFQDYAPLHRWSCDEPGAFWQAVATQCGLMLDHPPSQVVKHGDTLQQTRWFVDAKLNFTKNCLAGNPEATAYIEVHESGTTQQVTRAELSQSVQHIAQAMLDVGVQPGDRVCALAPNAGVTLSCFLAAAAIGAVWSSCSPDFGVDAVLARFQQIQPKLLLVADAYEYKGKRFSLADTASQLHQALAPVATWTLPYLDQACESNHPRLAEVLSQTDTSAPWQYPSFDFSHPLCILFSSGTTGAPKCIVHSVGGTLIQHLKEHQLHTNLKPGEKMLFYTTCGWMMWNWLVSALASHVTLVLYDGSPFFPDNTRLFDLVDNHHIDVLGVSAKYLSELEKQLTQAQTSLKKTHSLSNLNRLLSTGSPLLSKQFEWLYAQVKQDFCVSSISGGTDIISCFGLGHPDLPVYAGEIQCKGLGLDVVALDDNAQSVINARGELACANAFPSMPLRFWQDTQGQAYQQAYFATYPGYWCHGDDITISPKGSIRIFGRSDTLLNPGGVRIGPAEIYQVVEAIAGVQESLVVAIPEAEDLVLVLWLVLEANTQLDDGLAQAIRQALKSNASPRHVPKHILATPELPRTTNGKLSELSVKRVLCDQNPGNLLALSNPEALDRMKNIWLGYLNTRPI